MKLIPLTNMMHHMCPYLPMTFQACQQIVWCLRVSQWFVVAGCVIS